MEIILLHTKKGMRKTMVMIVGIAPFEVDCEGFGIWVEHFDHYTLGSLGSDWVDIPCVAWMPLPTPYKEEPE